MKSRGRALGVILAFLFIATSGCGHKSPTAGTGTQTPTAPTVQPAAPLGKPGGSETSGTIGPGGGALNSADGRVSIEVPPGAIPGDTAFTIQPIEGSEPNGIGPIYVLSPEGMTFAQPVTLTWHLSDADLAGHPIEAVSIATRDAEGQWISQPGVVRDVGAKTVRVTTAHLSPWEAYLPDIIIVPDHAEVHVRNSVALHVSRTEILSDPDLLAPPGPASSAPQTTYDNAGVELTPPTQPAASGPKEGDELTPPVTPVCLWKLNGKTGGGDGTVGHLGATSETEAEYTAPAKVPPVNPVAVSCEVTYVVKGRKAKTIAVAYVTVTDKKGWKGTFEYLYSDSSKTAQDTSTLTREETRRVNGSFKLEVSPIGNGIVGGNGNGTVSQTIGSSTTNPICASSSASSLAGPLQVDAQGVVGSGAGSLTLSAHGDNLSGKTEHKENCSRNGSAGTDSWNNGSFAVTCQLIGLDFDKGGTYTTPVEGDQGKGTCKVSISPE